MKGNVRRWFAIAGICCAAGIALMMAALAVVGFDVRQLQMPIPMGISMPGVPAASEVPAAPASPAEPASPVEPAVPAKAEVPAEPAYPTAPAAPAKAALVATTPNSIAPESVEDPGASADLTAPSVAGLSAETPASSMTVAASAESALSTGEGPSASFDFADKFALGLRSLSYVVEALW